MSDTHKEYMLTSEQITHSDTLRARASAIEDTLRIALNTHSNHSEELSKDRSKFWEGINEVMGVNLNKYMLSLVRHKGTVMVEVTKVPKPEEGSSDG